MSVKNRMLEILAHYGVGQAAFEKKVGVSNGYINNLKGSPGAIIISKITKAYPGINTEWLLTGEGEMLKPAKNPFSQMTEREIGETVSEVLMEMYKKGEIYSANMYNKAIAERDKRIEELQRKIWELERENENK